MKESATIKMAQMARDLRDQGHDVISLSLGEPDFDTPDIIKEAAKKALDDGFTKYTPVPGLVGLRQAISKKFKDENDLDYAPDPIVVSNGAKQCIANLSLSLLDEGDEAIILAPYWVSYYEIIRLSGATPVLVTAGIDQDYKVSAAQIKAAITDKTKLILFSSPCNPTGSVYSADELQAIVDAVAPHERIMVASDEIYEYINFTTKHKSIGSFPELKDRAITINGFSKGYAMTGWRLGYMGAPKWLAAACTKMQGQFTSGANSFSQQAAIYALENKIEATDEMKAAFLRRRNMVINLLKEIDGMQVNEPEGAFYIFPDISQLFGKSTGDITINNADDYCEYLLQHAHVAVVSGNAFGAPNCFRISYAASDEELKEAIRRIKEATDRLA